MKSVVKRNGITVDYNESKIYNAISKANAEVDDNEKLSPIGILDLTAKVTAQLNLKYPMGNCTVEDIQDTVEEALVTNGNYQIAKKYIIYRFTRQIARGNTTDQAILDLVSDKNEEMKGENSNKNTVAAGTQRDYIAGIVSRDIATRLLLPKRVSEAHEKCILHFHDSDYALSPEFNCCLVNIGDMLDNGTCINGKMIETPKSFQVACTVATQIMAAVASNQYGGQSIDMRHFGKYLRRSHDKFDKEIRSTCPELSDEEVAKLVKMEMKRELASGVQTMQYQINTLYTTNG